MREEVCAGEKNTEAHDSAEIERISSSPAMLRLTDSFLSLEREDASRVFTAFLYFKSARRSNRDFLQFLVTRQFSSSINIGFDILPALLSGLISDREFRTLILAMLKSIIQNPSSPIEAR